MDSRDRIKLQRHYATLLDVMYSSISPHLISMLVITMDMHEEIDSKPTERKKMERLLGILPSRGADAMPELINALRPSYAWIARQLENNDIDNGRPFPGVPNSTNRNLPDQSISMHVRDITEILKRSMRVATHWTFLAYSMSLMPCTIMDIKRDMSYNGGTQYAISTMLHAWVNSEGHSMATFSKLISLLQREGMNSSAEEITEFWAALDYPHQSVGRSRQPIITGV